MHNVMQKIKLTLIKLLQCAQIIKKQEVCTRQRNIYIKLKITQFYIKMKSF